MTVDKVCGIVQGFPILLILAQKNQLCLNNPLVYIPPAPNNQVSYQVAVQTLLSAMGSKIPTYYYPSYDHNYNIPNTYSYGSPHGPSAGAEHGVATGSSQGYGISYPYSYNVKDVKITPNYQQNVKPQVIFVKKMKIRTKPRGKGRSEELAALTQNDTDDTCITPDGYSGHCVNIRSCPPLLDSLKLFRSNAAVADYLRSSQCGYEGIDPKVCCNRGSTQPPPTSAPVTAPPTPAPVDDQQYPDDYCGDANSTLPKVVGGVDARLGDLPWMALLGYTGRDEVENGKPDWKCGGALVSTHHIVTAAHCMDGRLANRLYLVRLGELDLASDTDGASPVDYRIASKVMHQEYDPVAHVNDIAVLTLQDKVRFTKLIRPICFPLSPQLRSNDFVRYRPLIAGWGDLQFQGPRATKLQMLQLPVLSNDQCRQAYKKYTTIVIDERTLCAGDLTGGHDSCQGDSGGPLMQPLTNPDTLQSAWYLIGVVSYGVKCAEPGYPGVYMRVTAYLPWIQEQMGQ